MGRNDHQVKLFGNRVELEEIQALLNTLPNIKESLVLLKDQQLVAYLVVGASSTLPIPELQSELRKSLPGCIPLNPYLILNGFEILIDMIPHQFVMLENFPLTAHGKIDQLSLPLPVQMKALVSSSNPEDEIEARLMKIWSRILFDSFIHLIISLIFS